jgi:hypothetical protein
MAALCGGDLFQLVPTGYKQLAKDQPYKSPPVCTNQKICLPNTSGLYFIKMTTTVVCLIRKNPGTSRNLIKYQPVPTLKKIEMYIIYLQNV